MEIRHRPVKELTKTEYLACYKANYGPWDGYMCAELVDARNERRPGEVIMLWDGPDDTVRSLLGWALLTPVRREGLIGVTEYVTRNSKYTVQFWVKKQHRRKGYGKILMNEVKKFDPKPHVMPHDEASGELFSSFSVVTMQIDKHWLRRKPLIA